MSNISFETRCLSSLSKVLADEELSDPSYSRGSALWNETYSFQVAYRSDRVVKPLRVTVLSDIQEAVQLRAVGLIPVELPNYHEHDGALLRSTPGLYPDPLYPVGTDGFRAYPSQWRSVWVTIQVSDDTPAGVHPIDIVFETGDGQLLSQERFELDVIPAGLPPQELIHTEWFHLDCLATRYKVDIFSEEHWQLIDSYLETAVKHGINMILTPLFTPPLDTAVGGERPTVQLLDVEKTGDSYRFGFERLKRWVDLCNRKGVEYFEFSHFFTQWGAKHAPKIVAVENGETKRIFGWDTDAAGEDYKRFLSQLFPELVSFIKRNGLEDRSYFHVSDEPSSDHLESYRSASGIVREYLDEFPIIDALADYQYYEAGLVKNPIPANDHIEPFLENKVPELWTYYCCGQHKSVSNRFVNYASARNRIIGMQLYKFDIAGFLHWGYNFWYSQGSTKEIDPYRVSDADCMVPAGDAFVVYPGEQGPIESIRLEVFFEALQDLRAYRLLGALVGKQAVVALLEEGLDKEITFSEYPMNAEWLLAGRERLNRAIAEHSRAAM